jgi:hypothetical protein
LPVPYTFLHLTERGIFLVAQLFDELAKCGVELFDWCKMFVSLGHGSTMVRVRTDPGVSAPGRFD